MEINEVKNILETAGFTAVRTRTDEYLKKDIETYEFTLEGVFRHGSIVVNGFDLYASNFNYFKIDISSDSVVVRLYHGIHYIGCHVVLTEDLETFEVEPIGRD